LAYREFNPWPSNFKTPLSWGLKIGGPGGARTLDTLLKRQVL
jgi:hypothetical protein